jgi:ABC-2 type transport system permease protein
MWGAFTSEWVKLRRRSMILWGFGAGMFFPILATVMTIERARSAPPYNRGHVAIFLLEQPNGLVHGVNDVSFLIGLVSLCLFAAAFSIEYSQGTLRNLLVREPRRIQLLSGKFLALLSFVAVIVIVATAIAIALGFALAPGKGIDTSAWTSATGISDLLQAVFHAFLAAGFYGVFGAALGVLLRSPAVSIPVAIVYFVPIEALIIGAIWSGGGDWLPGRLLVALARGGDSDASYHHALLMLGVYSIPIAAAIMTLFRRRDA